MYHTYAKSIIVINLLIWMENLKEQYWHAIVKLGICIMLICTFKLWIAIGIIFIVS
jgi:hypothetical protein